MKQISKLKIHRSTRDLILLLLVLPIVALVPLVYQASQVQHDISEQYIDHASAQAVQTFKSMTHSMTVTLGMVSEWGVSGLFSLSNPANLNELLFPVFGSKKTLDGISIGDVDGNSYYIRHEGDGLQTTYINAAQTPSRAVVTHWNDAFELGQSTTTNSTYDPRSRPWFAPALSVDDIFWTEPYEFLSTGAVGITASRSFIRKKDKKQLVVAFDIELDKLFMEIQKMAPSANSRVFIFRHDAKIYMPEAEGPQPDFLSINLIEDPLVRKVHERWLGDNNLTDNVVSIQYDGTSWWCGFKPLEDTQRSAWICVMVPESDILSRADNRRLLLLMVGLGLVLVSAGFAFWIFRRDTRALEDNMRDVFDEDNPVTSIHSLISLGEGRRIEFKATMRMNLHTQKPGKEIELAWLKGVSALLNTDGGTLLLGVADDGQISGLEQDVFENSDKCQLHFKNLVARHIGAELSKYIRFIVVPMSVTVSTEKDQKTVGVVLCSRSSEPVFLKNNDKESFYIRNGPASDELAISKALKYIKHRK